MENFKEGVEIAAKSIDKEILKRSKNDIESKIDSISVRRDLGVDLIESDFAKIACKNVGIILDDWKSQKHFGDLQKELKARGLRYFCFIFADTLAREFDMNLQDFFGDFESDSDNLTQNNIESALEKCNEKFGPTFLISSDFFAYLKSCALFVGTGAYDNFSPKVRYLRLCNTFYSVGNSQFHNEFGRFAWTFWLAKSVNAGFLASVCERNFKDVNEFLSQTKIGYNPTNILKIGYLGLDNIESSKKSFQKEQDSIIILSLVKSPFVEILSECVELCLNAGLRVVYKTHNGHLEFREKERELAQKWLKNPNFIFYEEPNLSEEECARALCVVEFRSSMLYSFCLKNFKPAIVLSADLIESERSQKSIESIESKSSQNHKYTELFSFFEPNLHISAKNPQELLKIALKLKNSAEFRKQWHDRIENYAKTEVFNYKNASAAVADFALKFLKAQSVLW